MNMMMTLLLVGTVQRYLGGLLSTREFEDWIVVHMQDVLDSGDQRAIELAETIDALLIELHERLFGEEDFRARLAGLLQEPTAVTGSATITTTEVWSMPSPVRRITWAPSSAAAGR